MLKPGWSTEMDKKTRETIARIHASIPRNLIENIMKTEKNTEMNTLADEVIGDKSLNQRGRDKLKKMREDGFFDEENVPNLEAREEIDRYVTAEMQKAVASGAIKLDDHEELKKKGLI